MQLISPEHIATATSPSPWDFGNAVLYELCDKHPLHREIPVVIAKVWLIGRSYAAAIERRRANPAKNDDFYIETVAPEIIRSEIDAWIGSVSQQELPDGESLGLTVVAHSRVTGLFKKISGLDKRSLASKYLHFHRPSHFYIYDSRAVNAMRDLSPIIGRTRGGGDMGDNEYRKFAQKCVQLQTFVIREFGIALSPRQIDKLLLAIHEIRI
ncbi:MAG: hypothetical protein HY847_12375 [Betaproteobacteria bacterium]|nr:hypothetical protein [Betaproteobacteria bacterium]